MKKKLFVLLLVFCLLLTVGCGKEKNVEGTLADLMSKVYEAMPEDDRPMMLTNIEVTKENESVYLGSEDIEFKEALASESMVGSIAHSVVLVRANDGQDVEKLKADIKANVNPRKWICVGIDDESNVIVDSIGDLVILIMDNDYAQKLDESFKNLK